MPVPVRAATMGPGPSMPLASLVPFCAKWNMTREWLPVIVIIDCGESMIMSLATLWVTHHDCGQSSEDRLNCKKGQPGWCVHPFTPHPITRLFSSSCLKTKGCSKKTWVLIPTWPPVTVWSLENLFHRHRWPVLRIQVFEELGIILSLQWWLILHVKLTEFLGAQMKHQFLVCLWGCFQMRFELESVHLVNHRSPLQTKPGG